MERNEVSTHEARLFLAVEKRGGKWATSKELAAEAGIAERTARAHLFKMVGLNILDIAEVFPAHRYRFADKADKRNAAYVIRLRRAVEVFGLG